MKEKFKLYGSIFILAVFVPYLITLWMHGGFTGTDTDPVKTQIEEQLPFVVAKEISAGSDMECLKAQAIIARTNLWRQYQEALGDTGKEKQTEKNANRIESATEQELKDAWGTSAYESNMQKLRQAMEETSDKILTFEGKPIQAAYHYAANCKTRNASEVPGQEAAQYLQSVESEDDMLADGFLTIRYMEKQEFADALATVFQEEMLVADQMPGAVELTTRDSADYVTEVTCGTTVANGEAVRQALHLKSSCFYLSELDGKIRIVTKGIGHGLGLSQYGAQQLASQGKSCREILTYYYHGIEINSW